MQDIEVSTLQVIFQSQTVVWTVLGPVQGEADALEKALQYNRWTTYCWIDLGFEELKAVIEEQEHTD